MNNSDEKSDGKGAIPGSANELGLSPLRSVHTESFAKLLDAYGASIAVTTYQAGKLVFLRPELSASKAVVNTHFRNFRKPMGFAWETGRFAIGTQSEIWEFHDIPAVAAKLEQPEGGMQSDAAFLPRSCHVTGDVDIHEILWVPPAKATGTMTVSELSFVNTRFSCISSRSYVHSFLPRWKPRFISQLAPEDRCHLNGMAMRDNQLRYVTALGEADTPSGWRQNKKSGGIVIDTQSAEVIARGLSMPHSPRWHDEKLWLLESGNGGLGVLDVQNGRYEELCRLPGFTRGLDFLGPYALIGLSQVRESATFSGIKVAEMLQSERYCGVWVVDTRSGSIFGFVKFTDAVQEIFAVQALNGIRWPEVLNENNKLISETYELPDEALIQVPHRFRH